jgi:hypothetical protein
MRSAVQFLRIQVCVSTCEYFSTFRRSVLLPSSGSDSSKSTTLLLDPKMEVARYSKKSVTIYQSRRRNIRKDYRHQHRCENLKSRNTVSVCRLYFICVLYFRIPSLLAHGHRRRRLLRLWTQQQQLSEKQGDRIDTVCR